MQLIGRISSKFSKVALLGAVLLLSVASAATLHAEDFQALPIVKPVMSCDQLSQTGTALSKAAGVTIAVKTASIRETDKGAYCRVTGTVDPQINFVGDLPMERWTQRYVQGAQGREGIQRAGSCQPALNGEIAVATVAGGGYPSTPGSAWGMSPQARINSAYLGQHMTSVAMKAVIQVFYGQPVKFSYMIGCSGGGGETLMNAERFPADFDGYSIGAPPIYDTVHNLGFWHGWEYHVNQRADGSIILAKDRLGILHDAAIAHCPALTGMIDNGLEQPTACAFQKSWVECPTGTSDTSKCLTAEEANVAEQLYLGPNDGRGRFFEISGWPLGSELLWHLSSQGKPADGEGLNPNGLHRLMMPPLSGESTPDLMARFTFTQDWWDKALDMAPLFNVANTNLRPLAKLNHKIILWNGTEDTVVQPAVTISYYEGVQKEVGEKLTDTFLRYFLLPGVGHCGMGDGANQVDVLTPLMAWVELHKAPLMLIAGRPVQATEPGGGGPGGFGGPGGQRDEGRPPNYPPYAEPDKATVYTRPVYPFPNVVLYKGKGDANDAASYREARGPLKTPQAFPNETSRLLGPDNQKLYKAEGDQLIAVPKP